MLATDWVSVSSIATAAATFVLALATFASVRSGNRTARAAERSLLLGLRPVLMPSHADDPPQKVGFFDDRWFRVAGSGAIAEVTDAAIYLAASLRNVGTGIAVLHGWYLHPGRRGGDPSTRRSKTSTGSPAISTSRPARWASGRAHSVIRADPAFAEARAAIEEPRRITVEILYGDHELGRRAISLFSLTPREDGAWLLSVARHWNVDGADPR